MERGQTQRDVWDNEDGFLRESLVEEVGTAPWAFRTSAEACKEERKECSCPRHPGHI